MRQFLGFAASKSSFAITRLSYLHLNTDLADSPLTLANSLAKKDQYLNLEIPEDVKVTLEQLTVIVVAKSIINKDIFSFYQKLSFENINTSKLKNFGHKRLAAESLVEIGRAHV